jgi:hypothetical protein
VLRILKRLVRRGRVIKLLHGDEVEYGKRTGEPTPVVYRLSDARAPRARRGRRSPRALARGGDVEGRMVEGFGIGSLPTSTLNLRLSTRPARKTRRR